MHDISGEAFVQHTFFDPHDNTIGDFDESGGHGEGFFNPHRPFRGSQRPNHKRPHNLLRPVGGGGLNRPLEHRPHNSFEIDRPSNNKPIIIFTDDDNRKPLTRPTRKPDDDFHSLFSERPFTFDRPDSHSPFHDDNHRPVFEEPPHRPGSFADHGDEPDFVFDERPTRPTKKRPSKRPPKPFRPGPVRKDPPSRHPFRPVLDNIGDRGNYGPILSIEQLLPLCCSFSIMLCFFIQKMLSMTTVKIFRNLFT